MNLNFSSEQNMIKESVASFLADNYSFEQREKALNTPPHWQKDIWQKLATDLGLLAAPFPEKFGGFGGGPIENMLLMEEFGKALVLEPYVSTVVIGGGFFKYSEHSKATEYIESIINGELIIAFAQAERGSRYSLHSVSTRSEKQADGWLINGTKRMVIAAPCASHFIVTARTSKNQNDKQGISVFFVDRQTPGVSVNEYQTYDGLLAADVSFNDVKVPIDALIGDANKGLLLVEKVVDEAIAATCAEAVGVLKKMLALTLEYTQTREQFGQPISRFQVLQHQMADMFISLEQAVSLTLLATIRCQDGEAQLRSKAVSQAKAQIGLACSKIAESAIQLHGGMGLTQEMAVSHYFKRATMIESMFGSVDYHLGKIEALSA